MGSAASDKHNLQTLTVHVGMSECPWPYGFACACVRVVYALCGFVCLDFSSLVSSRPIEFCVSGG
jgi:hypothetical protein